MSVRVNLSNQKAFGHFSFTASQQLHVGNQIGTHKITTMKDVWVSADFWADMERDFNERF